MIEDKIVPFKITIDSKFYFKLLLRSAELSRLDEYGVDNWVGYGDSMEGFEEEIEELINFVNSKSERVDV